MAPYGEDFKQINIPVLAIEGYYNDSQNSSLYYLREIEKYHPAYLVIYPDPIIRKEIDTSKGVSHFYCTSLLNTSQSHSNPLSLQYAINSFNRC